MENLAVQIQSLPIKPDDVIILTFSRQLDLDTCNECFATIKKICPNLTFIPNREDILKNITVLDMQTPFISCDEGICVSLHPGRGI